MVELRQVRSARLFPTHMHALVHTPPIYMPGLAGSGRDAGAAGGGAYKSTIPHPFTWSKAAVKRA